MQNFNTEHISPEKEKNMPSTYLVSQPEPSSDSKGEFTPEVICCNKDLVKRFQLPTERTLEIGQSARYLKKAFHCVAENARSLSLPSFSNRNECQNSTENNPIEESLILTQNGNDIVNNVSDNSNIKCPDDSWFRTWPERGYDRIVNGHILNNSDSAGSDEVENNCKCHTSSNLSSPVSQKNNNKHVCNLSNHSVTMSAQGNCVNVCGCNVSDLKKEQNSSIPLNDLLQNIPLAYSPVTRQLHVINQDSSVKSPPDLCDKSDLEQKQLCKTDRSENYYGGQFQTDCSKSHSRSGSNSDTFPSVEDAVSYESPRSTLQRFGVYGTSLFKADTSSFSSIVSSLSDVSPSTNEDGAAGNLLDPDSISIACSGNESLDCSEHNALFEDSGAKPKRRGISGFFSRNVFGWKSLNSSSNNTQVWRLFGKASSCKPSEQEEEVRCVPDSPVSIRSTGSGNKRYEDVVASSSALILHDRPSNLPAKSLDEDIKHRLEYQTMVEAARKKEMKEAKLRKKQMQQQLKFEEQLANAARIWSNEILPKWDLMKNSRKARDLWWSGIPPSVRGKVWKLALGNDLNITHELYEICVARSQELLKAAENGNSLEHQVCNDKSPDEFRENPDKESSVELVQLDISRTFPHLCIFQKGGPYYDILHSMLGAYVCYRPDVGYVQGMSFIAAVLILNMEAADAFICFANLLNQPCHMAFFRLNQEMMQAYYAAYNDFFQENLPRLFAHFAESSLSADLYLLDWLYTVFAKAMPLDVACRVWDVFLRDGEEFLFKTALGVLHLNQESLMKLDFIHGAQFLTKLPDDMAADKLFKSIEAIKMNVGKQKFSEVLAYHVEQLCGDGGS